MKRILIGTIVATLAIQLVSAEVISEDNVTDTLTRPVETEKSATSDEYAVTLLRNSSSICKGVIIAPSWVLTAKHCATQRLNFVTAGKKSQKKRVEQKIHFKDADIALLRVEEASFNEERSAQILANALPTSHQFTYKKVIHNAQKGISKIYDDLILKVKNKKRLKSLTPKGKAGSSGAPWVVNTDNGDVVVGITHGGGRAPQVAQAKKWVNVQVKKWTPNENVKWVTDIDTIFQGQ